MSRILAVAVLFGLVVACGDTPTTEPDLSPHGIALQIISGDEQSGLPGEELPNPLVVRATDAKGRPLNHVVVSFVPTMGGGSAWAGAANTDPQGYAMEYWTLGPEPAENRMEARVVDPRNGDKLVLGEFIATATGTVTPSVEVCNGLDDDGDSQIDEGFPYCISGSPAPNTDGVQCDPGWVDFDQDATNGCEWDSFDGTYTLDPTLSTSCPVAAIPVSISVSRFDVTWLGSDQIRIDVPVSFYNGLFRFNVAFILDYDTVLGGFTAGGSDTQPREGYVTGGSMTVKRIDYDVEAVWQADGSLAGKIFLALYYDWSYSLLGGSDSCTLEGATTATPTT